MACLGRRRIRGEGKVVWKYSHCNGFFDWVFVGGFRYENYGSGGFYVGHGFSRLWNDRRRNWVYIAFSILQLVDPAPFSKQTEAPAFILSPEKIYYTHKRSPTGNSNSFSLPSYSRLLIGHPPNGTTTSDNSGQYVFANSRMRSNPFSSAPLVQIFPSRCTRFSTHLVRGSCWLSMGTIRRGAVQVWSARTPASCAGIMPPQMVRKAAPGRVLDTAWEDGGR